MIYINGGPYGVQGEKNNTINTIKVTQNMEQLDTYNYGKE